LLGKKAEKMRTRAIMEELFRKGEKKMMRRGEV